MRPEFELPRPLSDLERVLALKSFSGLSHLAPAQLAVIAENAEERFHPAGSEIYAEGNPVSELHYILEGKVAVRRRGVVVSELGERSVIGGLAILASVSDGQQVVALEDTHTLAVSEEAQTEIFEDNFEMLLAVLRRIAGELIAVRRQVGGGAGFAPGGPPGTPPRSPLTLVDKLAHLRKSAPFAFGRLEAAAELAREAREVRCPAGELLWREGEVGASGYLLVAGEVAGEAADRGQSFRLTPGDIAGGLDSIARQPRWFEARAATDLCALEIEVEVLLDVLEDNVDMAMELLRVLADAILGLRERLAGAS